MANRKLIDKALNFLAKPTDRYISFNVIETFGSPFYTPSTVRVYKRGFYGKLVVILNSQQGTPQGSFSTYKLQLASGLDLYGLYANGSGLKSDSQFVASVNTNGLLTINAYHGNISIDGQPFYVTFPLHFNK